MGHDLKGPYPLQQTKIQGRQAPEAVGQDGEEPAGEGRAGGGRGGMHGQSARGNSGRAGSLRRSLFPSHDHFPLLRRDGHDGQAIATTHEGKFCEVWVGL